MYLTSSKSAVVLEGLRMAHGITSRQPRIAVDEILQYKEWFIPIGVRYHSVSKLVDSQKLTCLKDAGHAVHLLASYKSVNFSGSIQISSTQMD